MTTIVAGKYRIGAEIGRGGMGIVYRAEHVQTGAPVALKMLLKDGSGGPVDAKARARFEREMLLTSRLQHENTVRIVDSGHSEEGAPFLVCELLAGRTLAEVIADEGRVASERAARIAVQVLGALEEAHGLGIIHRDIKPQNIFLCPDDFVKVLDFGVATRPDSTTSPPLTTAGNAVGTLRYMAPEQLEGKEVGPPSDLYALGLVLAEAIHGGPIVAGMTPHSMFMMQLSPLPVPIPVDVATTAIGPIVLRAVQKEQGQRFTSAAEMRHALLLALGHSVGPWRDPAQGFRASTIGFAAAAAFFLSMALVWITASAIPSAAAPAGERSARTSKPAPSQSRGPSRGLVPAQLHDVSKEHIEEEIARAGLKATVGASLPGGTVWNLWRGEEPVGQVQYFPSDEMSAMFIAESCAEGDGIYARDDGRVLCVEIEDEQGEERALFDAIVGED